MVTFQLIYGLGLSDGLYVSPSVLIGEDNGNDAVSGLLHRTSADIRPRLEKVVGHMEISPIFAIDNRVRPGPSLA